MTSPPGNRVQSDMAEVRGATISRDEVRAVLRIRRRGRFERTPYSSAHLQILNAFYAEHTLHMVDTFADAQQDGTIGTATTRDAGDQSLP